MPEIIHPDYHNCLSRLQKLEIFELARALLVPGVVFTAGNGGSAATASHFASDLRRRGIRASCLADNTAFFSGLANDRGYEQVFSYPLELFGVSHDALFVISGSGNSTNLILAVETARQRGIKTLGLLAFGGGILGGLVDHALVLPTHDYGVAEGVHSCLCHILVGVTAMLYEPESWAKIYFQVCGFLRRGPPGKQLCKKGMEVGEHCTRRSACAQGQYPSWEEAMLYGTEEVKWLREHYRSGKGCNL